MAEELQEEQEQQDPKKRVLQEYWPNAKALQEKFERYKEYQNTTVTELKSQKDSTVLGTTEEEELGHAPIAIITSGNDKSFVRIGHDSVQIGDSQKAPFSSAKNDHLLFSGKNMNIILEPLNLDPRSREAEYRLSRAYYFEGDARVVNNSGLAVSYALDEGQTLHITGEIPEYHIDNKGRAPVITPIEDHPANMEMSHNPERDTRGLNPVMLKEYVNLSLADGSVVSMRPGAKVIYQPEGFAEPLLEYTAQAGDKFAVPDEVKAGLEQAKLDCEEAKKESGLLKAKYEETQDKTVRKAMYDAYGKRDSAERAYDALKETQYQPDEETLAKLENANERFDAFVKQRSQQRENLSQGNKEAYDAAIAHYSAPGRQGEAIENKRAVGDFELGANLGATVLRPMHPNSKVQLSGNEITIGETDPANRAIPELVEPVYQTEAIQNNTLVLDGEFTTLSLTDTEQSVTLQAPLRVISTGSLSVDMRRMPPSYLAHPLEIRQLPNAEKNQTFSVTVPKQIEWQFFNGGSALSANDRYREGLIVDEAGKVTGFQTGGKGPRFMLEPGQQLMIKTNEYMQQDVTLNLFVGERADIRYPEHRFFIEGGKDREAMMESLKEQKNTMDEKQPMQVFDENYFPKFDENLLRNPHRIEELQEKIKEYNEKMDIRFPQASSHGLPHNLRGDDTPQIS